ncbi:MAG TPA: SusC/RagA family TonB-linked outer membrane protein [Gemmatimonadales bacterium]|jgi:TonB-linked SusC/RagA family outer membrane protein|nr:SusC/RagA family TonB-linked outer membrane protein [Gemmatimonadales bacterium]
MNQKIIRVGAALGIGLLFALTLSTTAVAQETQVSGTVTATSGEPLSGVTVQVRGTGSRTVTDANGKYSLTAPPDGVLLFALIGYKGAARTIAGRTTIDVGLEPAVAVLEPVIVTGYTSQRRADITGAVSSVNVESATQQTSTSVLQRLDGRVPGVQVENSGSPGSRTTVRIRGVSSFQNNDPLLIVDGTPVQDTYLNWLNPNEIGSVQVLKDASAASIYGSRASNGVIIIETKRGRAGQRQLSLDVRTGFATPVRGYDDILILDALDYFQVMKVATENAGLAVKRNIYGDPNNPSVPDYIWPNDGVNQSCTLSRPTCSGLRVDSASYAVTADGTRLIMPGSPGTNWWKAVFGTGQIRDANLAISGGGEDNAYHVSFNYLDQEGTAAFTRFQRGGVRVNTTFHVNKVTIGENIALSRDRSYGGLDDGALGEGNIVGKNIFQQPVVPIYDINGYYASGKAVGLSNLTNPLKIADAGQFNIATNDRIFGNIFGSLDAGRSVVLNSRLGFNLGQGSFHGFTATTPENSEVTAVDGINENYSLFTVWTWSNTLTFTRAMNQHNLNVLLGQAASQGTSRFEAGSCAGLLNTDVDSRYIQDALCDPTTKNVTSSGGKSALLSLFGKADYNYGERYYLNFTLRRDGSSRFGPTNRWGTFPAIGMGWRLSRESFLRNSTLFSNAMLRFGWGITGNEQIPSGRIVSQFGGDRGDTFYDIGGTSTTIRPGFKTTAIGNPNLKWEENRSVNVGVDLEFKEGRGTFSVDVYRRNTNNLLFDPRTPATAGSAAPPIINIGKMTNNGFDFSVGYRGQLGAVTQYSVNFNGSHYKNEIVEIDGVATFFFGPGIIRDQNPIINQVGAPIGSFYGLVANGYYRDSADAAPFFADGARPGRIKFVDQPTVLDTIACPAAPGCVGLYRPDGSITGADRAVIGSPHPDFVAGLDLSVRHGNWDFSATLFGTFGNEIFNTQKYWDVFRYFDTNVRKDRLANSWTPTNQDAKYPKLDASDTWSRQFSSYWVEDGSYVRLRTLQIGYSLPPAMIRWIPVARVYLQAENLFTITGYSGLDPSLPAASVFGAAGDIRDQFRGVDQGTYPSNKTITIGISTTF